MTPSGNRTYRGALRSATPVPGGTARDTVNVLTMDDYVRGVIPTEMPASWQPEAVKAQAVAARTYATWSRSQYPTRYYQICDTSYCQVYGGLGAEDARSNAAVTATARQILTYDGKPAFTQFSSSSGGWTSAGSVPYLAAKRRPVRRLRRQPGARLDAVARRARRRTGVPETRHAEPDPGDPPRRQRRVERPGLDAGPGRQQVRRHRVR